MAKWYLRAVTATVVSLAILGVMGCGDSVELSKKAPAATETPSPAHILASLDAGQLLERDDSRISEYEAAMDAAGKKCTNEPTRIADFAQVGVELLAKDDIEVTRLEMLRAIANSVPEGARVDCAEVAAAIVTLMGSE